MNHRTVTHDIVNHYIETQWFVHEKDWNHMESNRIDLNLIIEDNGELKQQIISLDVNILLKDVLQIIFFMNTWGEKITIKELYQYISNFMYIYCGSTSSFLKNLKRQFYFSSVEVIKIINYLSFMDYISSYENDGFKYVTLTNQGKEYCKNVF